jgi:NitT/TauT family transport system permease protein/taurine transport system permease protein
VLWEFAELVWDGVLLKHVAASLGSLAVGFCIGAGTALVLGVAMAVNYRVAAFAEPLVVFLQAIAGITWIPLAIIWFGFGIGPVVFVVANAVFFVALFNTILGVQSIPMVLHHAVLTLGGGRLAILREVVIPGALANVLVGLRTALAFGWRALVTVEIIAANKGLGFMLLDASQRYESARVVVGIVLIGSIWLAMDRLLLRTIEMRTVERWGLVRREPG